MKKTDPELMVAYLNSTFAIKMAIYSVAILVLGTLAVSQIHDFKVAMFFVLWAAFGGAAAAIWILLVGQTIKGFQAANVLYSTNKAEKTRIKAKYAAVKKTKPCNLSLVQVLICAGAGLVLAAGLAMTL